MKKVSIATCNGMSSLGLIGRATCIDLAAENDDIISICITATAAGSREFSDIIKKYPILAINGCSSNCVNKILKSQGVNPKKTMNIDDILNDDDLKDGDPVRLNKKGEKAVEKLKIAIKKELEKPPFKN